MVVLPLPVGPVARKSPCGFSTKRDNNVERSASETAAVASQAARSAGQANVIYISDKTRVVGELERVLKSGDLLLTMGAGDVVRLGEAYLAGGGGG